MSEQEFDKFYLTIIKNIRRERENRNLSQLQMSKEMDFQSSSFYAEAENGSSSKRFNLKHIFKIAKIFNISINDLIKD